MAKDKYYIKVKKMKYICSKNTLTLKLNTSIKHEVNKKCS